MTGTDEPIDLDSADIDALQHLSDEILKEAGIESKQEPGEPDGQSEGAGHGAEGSGAANPDVEPRPDQKPEPDMNAAWIQALPEKLQRDLPSMDPATVDRLRELAEGGLRQSDYTRKTQQLADRERRLAELEKKAELADLLLHQQVEHLGQNAAAAPADDTDQLIAELIAESDPKAFREKFQKFAQREVKEVLKTEREKSPEYRAHKVETALEQIYSTVADSLPDESVWTRGLELFGEHLRAFGIDWRTLEPNDLPREIRPHLRNALAEYALRERGIGGKPSSQPSGQEPTGASNVAAKPESGPAAISPGRNKATPTKTLEPHERENREMTEDEAFKKVLAKFGISGEDELERLRLLD